MKKSANQDVLICPTTHKHGGASTCYIQHRCRCDECCKQATDRAQNRNRLLAYGRWDTGRVDADPVRAHIELLRANGMGWKRIAEVAGVSKTVLSSVIYGRREPGRTHPVKRVSRETAEAVLAVRVSFETLRPGALIDPTGTRRRVEALQAVGYSMSWIAERIGQHPTNFTSVVKRDRVTVATRNAVAAVFDEYALTPRVAESWHERASVSRTLNHARKAGFVPALAWDDIDFDAAPATADEPVIDEVAVQLAVSGVHVKLTPVERREAVKAAYALGLMDTQIAERIGCDKNTVLRIRKELGLPTRFDKSGELVA